MNQIQFIGTHNSYHAGLAPGEMAVLQKQNPRAAASLNYKHPKIEAQLDAGVRQLEFDVYGDAKGGLFADPLFLRLAAKEGLVYPMPQGWAEAMKKPGFKVMHANDVDFRSHCVTFVACLQLVRTWSKAHPGHLPIYLQIENKEGSAREGFSKPEPLTKATMDALDVEIRSVFRGEGVGNAGRCAWKARDAGGGSAAGRLAIAGLGAGQSGVRPGSGEGDAVLHRGSSLARGPDDVHQRQARTPDAAFVKMNDATSPQITRVGAEGLPGANDDGRPAVGTIRRYQAAANGGWRAARRFSVRTTRSIGRRSLDTTCRCRGRRFVVIR